MEIFSKKKKEIPLNTSGKPIIKPVGKKVTGFQKAVTIYAVINLAVIGIFGFVSSKYSKMIKNDVKAVIDKRKNQSDINLLTEYVAILERDNNRVLKEFGPYLEMLPAKDDLLDFKSDIVNMAKKYKLDPAFSFGVENPATDSEPKSYGFTLIISGSTTNLFSFWNDFATMQYILRIEQILIDQEDSKTKSNQQSLGTGSVTTTATVATTVTTQQLTLEQELEQLAKKKATTTTKKKVTTTTTKLINTYKMNILGKIYIK